MKTNSKLTCKTILSFDGQPCSTRKDKNFYKPEKFIWNNPYRSSSRLYRYYHAANDQYEEKQVPRILKLEKQDKQNAQKERIMKVLKNRNKSREFLKQRQYSRQQLEKKSQGSETNNGRFFQSVNNLDHFLSEPDQRSFVDKNTTKTLKSLKTMKQLTNTQNQLPKLSGENQDVSLLPSRKATIKKVGSANQFKVTFNLKKRQ